MRWGMLIIEELELVAPELEMLPWELTGDGVGDIGEEVPVVFPLAFHGDGTRGPLDEFLK